MASDGDTTPTPKKPSGLRRLIKKISARSMQTSNEQENESQDLPPVPPIPYAYLPGTQSPSPVSRGWTAEQSRQLQSQPPPIVRQFGLNMLDNYSLQDLNSRQPPQVLPPIRHYGQHVELLRQRRIFQPDIPYARQDNPDLQHQRSHQELFSRRDVYAQKGNYSSPGLNLHQDPQPRQGIYAVPEQYPNLNAIQRQNLHYQCQVNTQQYENSPRIAAIPVSRHNNPRIATLPVSHKNNPRVAAMPISDSSAEALTEQEQKIAEVESNHNDLFNELEGLRQRQTDAKREMEAVEEENQKLREFERQHRSRATITREQAATATRQHEADLENLKSEYAIKLTEVANLTRVRYSTNQIDATARPEVTQLLSVIKEKTEENKALKKGRIQDQQTIRRLEKELHKSRKANKELTAQVSQLDENWKYQVEHQRTLELMLSERGRAFADLKEHSATGISAEKLNSVIEDLEDSESSLLDEAAGLSPAMRKLVDEAVAEQQRVPRSYLDGSPVAADSSLTSLTEPATPCPTIATLSKRFVREPSTPSSQTTVQAHRAAAAAQSCFERRTLLKTSSKENKVEDSETPVDEGGWE